MTWRCRFDKIKKYSKTQVTNEGKENKKTFQKGVDKSKKFW